MVKSREMFEYPRRVRASRVSLEPSARVSSPPVMGRNIQAIGEPGELQCAAQVRVGQGQGRVAVVLRLRKKLVCVGRPHPEGVEALGMKLDVAICNQALCRYHRSPLRS